MIRNRLLLGSASRPIWPLTTDFTVHDARSMHGHICPSCLVTFMCSFAASHQVCRAVEEFRCAQTHADGEVRRCAGERTTGQDHSSLQAHLHLRAPAFRSLTASQLPVTVAAPDEPLELPAGPGAHLASAALAAALGAPDGASPHASYPPPWSVAFAEPLAARCS